MLPFSNTPQPVVKRFLKVFTLLMIGLLLLVSGVDAALDRLADSPQGNSYTYYNNKGQVEVAYTGDLRLCPTYVRPGFVGTTTVLHRT